jgi:hypothetical protein
MKPLHASLGLVVVSVALAVGCGSGQKVALQASDAVPAATGEVHAEAANGNTKVDVEVEHLAPPSKIAAGANVYVVWAVRDAKDAAPQNLGQLKVDDDRKGKLSTLTPLAHFDVIVTPEADAVVGKPTNAPVMRASVDRDK